MDLYDFIESNEARDVKLLQLLLTAGTHGCSYSRLLESLQVTPSTLAATVASLQQRLQAFDEAAQIRQCNEGKGRRLFLETQKPVLFDDLYRKLLRQSKEYQILATLLEKGKCRVDEFVAQLYMSKAAVFRKIKQLNLGLKSHAIKIKNGTLIGSEVEIRYLYYQLVLNSYDSEELAALAATFSARRYIKRFEARSKVKFSPHGEIKLCVWLDIALKRHFTGDKKFTGIPEETLHQLEVNPLYHMIRNWLFEIAKQYALALDEFEVYNIYIFVCSMDIIDFSATDPRHVEKYLALALPTVQQRNQYFMAALRQICAGFETQCSDASRIRMQYTLNQLHHRIQFFQGDFRLLAQPADRVLISDQQLQHLETLASELTAIVAKDDPCCAAPAKRLFLTQHYVRLLMVTHVQIAKPIRIGLLLNDDWLATSAVMARLKLALAGMCSVVLEIAEAPATYDLLITSFKTSSAAIAAKHHYRINEIETTYDIDQIKSLLVSIIREQTAISSQF
ncbi:helix-turn-helix domain-containing protein [Lacticaseibacillus casei]|uniref:Helix-turn-helix domain-containing protein n=1 Tax=Lacticaseibacillus huelsenbergensis TaxID=3035291 RepID=A0ABY8DT83_9LACO|nr:MULTISPECIES: helix-turn-helix domain-containing protein [Lacticaseibacillus]MDG3060546.1 helix-turn-helix domain-containing protein [Lacticaseibacillus sp. BCRC 81376]QVI37568.1 helix-turn-helix domain-containing protein [Lacticaseibacillus casei]QXG59355.1 helix-turn-helix domain-containing protein [Lacticaseibacillus casei]WFB39187.1 helix-turn-helix domain-containing protein [Lacticaseibacillus huelsenbergensis]WFB40889.1 helix-turn-helix domain-containing protein [Lacticaseibacillus hu